MVPFQITKYQQILRWICWFFNGEISSSERMRNTKLVKEYVIMNEDALVREIGTKVIN